MDDDQLADVLDNFVRAVGLALAQGPLRQTVIDLAGGRRRIVVKENLTASGWIVSTEPVDSATDS